MALNKVSTSLYFVKRPQSSGLDSSSETYWVPNTDVYVSDGGLVIKVELAGMRREDLELTVDGNRLKISGHRPDGCRAPKCTFLVMEINYGVFESIIELPPGYDLSQAKATYQNGFLRIDVPEQSQPTQKTFSVSVSTGED
ncbi:MAG TPA: Hsp20/alpha crystallin family protein [Verrucomicrobiae bacterium]|nr:Hsp20/alpha crystallin family protein [Verrucomicrobiae bacterium]